MEIKLLEALMPLGIFLITLICGFIARKIILRRLARWAKNTKTKIDDIIIDSLREPFMIWFIMLGIYFTLQASRIPENLISIVNKLLLVLGVTSITFVLANISSKLIGYYSAKADSSLPVTSLTKNISRILIFTVGTLIILHSLGVSIAPILATLGVGGLAVALALQDTLSNLFAGFHIIASRMVKIGDYIKLDSGVEGYILDINWRITKIRMPSNNVVLVPNEKLSKAVVTNYYLPTKEIMLSIGLGVHYNSDLNRVERIVCEVAKEVMREASGGVSDFEPVARYDSFGDSSINLNVVLKAKEFMDQHLIKHEFIKKIHVRFNEEGIVIPYPIRAINYRQEKE